MNAYTILVPHSSITAEIIAIMCQAVLPERRLPTVPRSEKATEIVLVWNQLGLGKQLTALWNGLGDQKGLKRHQHL